MSSTDVNDIKVRVVRHDLAVLGERLVMMAGAVSTAMTHDEVYEVIGTLANVRALLVEIEHEDLTGIAERAPREHEQPF